jgi:hypothetical protein
MGELQQAGGRESLHCKPGGAIVCAHAAQFITMTATPASVPMMILRIAFPPLIEIVFMVAKAPVRTRAASPPDAADPIDRQRLQTRLCSAYST